MGLDRQPWKNPRSMLLIKYLITIYDYMIITSDVLRLDIVLILSMLTEAPYPDNKNLGQWMAGAHLASPIRGELGFAHWPQLGTQFIALLGTKFGAH